LSTRPSEKGPYSISYAQCPNTAWRVRIEEQKCCKDTHSRAMSCRRERVQPEYLQRSASANVLFDTPAYIGGLVVCWSIPLATAHSAYLCVFIAIGARRVNQDKLPGGFHVSCVHATLQMPNHLRQKLRERSRAAVRLLNRTGLLIIRCARCAGLGRPDGVLVVQGTPTSGLQPC
jgi:hypothetical protein